MKTLMFKVNNLLFVYDDMTYRYSYWPDSEYSELHIDGEKLYFKHSGSDWDFWPSSSNVEEPFHARNVLKRINDHVCNMILLGDEK